MKSESRPNLGTPRREFLKYSAASALSLACAPSAIAAANAPKDDAKIVLRCAVMSDVHFNSAKPDMKEAVRFRNSLRFVYDYCAKQKEYNRFDALVVVGDMSDNGRRDQIEFFKKTMDEEIHGETKTLLCMGNHEFYGGSHDLWREVFGVEINARYVVNGFSFIAISPEKGTCHNGDYLYAEDWVKEELEKATAEDPEKPIFVFQHYPLSPTVFGGRAPDDWGVTDLFDTLQQYPRVVDFSGHTHYSLKDPRIVWQGNFTAFGTSTLDYLCQGTFRGRYPEVPNDGNDIAEAYVMEVYSDNRVVMIPFDAAKCEFYGFEYVVYPGKPETYVYTDARYFNSDRPKWSDDAKATAVDVSDSYAKIQFPQAVSKDVVFSYRLEAKTLDENGEWFAEKPKYFISRYYANPVPETVVDYLHGLQPMTKYRVTITALNVYDVESVNTLEVEFTTTEDPLDAGNHNDPAPDANFIDLRVADGKIVNAAVNNLPKPKEFKLVGAPKVAKDADLDADVVAFGGSDVVTFQCNSGEYSRLRKLTLRAKVKLDSAKKSGNASILSNTEGTGTSLYVDYSGKKISFWVHVNGKYASVAASVAFDRWVDVVGVYDGTNAILYLDGVEVGRVNAGGIAEHPTKASDQFFGVGGEIGPNGRFIEYLVGKVARASVYSWSLTPEQVKNLAER